jgi:hypothetical protein
MTKTNLTPIQIGKALRLALCDARIADCDDNGTCETGIIFAVERICHAYEKINGFDNTFDLDGFREACGIND